MIVMHISHTHTHTTFTHQFFHLSSIKLFSSINSPPTYSSSYTLDKCIRLVIMFVITMFVLLKMGSTRAKCIWGKYGAFLNSFYPDVKWLRRLMSFDIWIEWIQKGTIFIHTYTQMCVCVCVYIYIHIHIQISTNALEKSMNPSLLSWG